LCVLVLESLFFTRPDSRFQASVSGVTVSDFNVILFRGPHVSIAINIYIQPLKRWVIVLHTDTGTPRKKCEREYSARSVARRRRYNFHWRSRRCLCASPSI
jgi:hypothetical protein